MAPLVTQHDPNVSCSPPLPPIKPHKPFNPFLLSLQRPLPRESVQRVGEIVAFSRCSLLEFGLLPCIKSRSLKVSGNWPCLSTTNSSRLKAHRRLRRQLQLCYTTLGGFCARAPPLPTMINRLGVTTITITTTATSTTATTPLYLALVMCLESITETIEPMWLALMCRVK